MGLGREDGAQGGERWPTLGQLWRERCRTGGVRPAMRHKRGGVWVSVSWQGFFNQARAIGLALLDVGVGPRDVISVLSQNRPEWLVTDMAAQSIGAIVHGVNPSSSSAGVVRALGIAGTCVLFAEHAAQVAGVLATEDRLADLRLIVVIDAQSLRGIDDPRVIHYGELLERGMRAAESGRTEFDDANDAGDENAIAMLVATAGTTQMPRLVAIPQRDSLERVRALARFLPLSPGDAMLSFASLSEPAERMAVLAALLMDHTLVYFAESPATVLNDLVEVAPQVLFAPPRFWERLHTRTDLFMRGATPLARVAWRAGLKNGRSRWWGSALSRRMRSLLGLQRVRMGVVTGGVIATPAADWYAALDVPMYQAYGLAEAGGICTIERLTCGASAGALDTGLRLNLAPDGEVLVCGAFSDIAYWNRGERVPVTATAQGWLRTDDAGMRTANGVQVMGRLPALRMSLDSSSAFPESAEQLLRASHFIYDAIVLAKPDGSTHCLLALEEDAIRQFAQDHDLPLADHTSFLMDPLIEALLRAEIEQANLQLPPQLQLSRFEILPFFLAFGMDEWTTALRLNRRVVLQRYAMSHAGGATRVPPTHPLAESVL